MSIKSAIKNVLTGTNSEQSLRTAIDKAETVATRARQTLITAEQAVTVASDAVNAERARLEAAAADVELIGLAELRRLEAVASDAQQMAEFAKLSAQGADARLTAARAKLATYLVEQARSNEAERMREFARIVVEQVKPAHDAIMAARAAREALGVREWSSVPSIDGLLAAAVEMAKPAPAAPATPDATRVVRFVQSAHIGRSFGGHSFTAGEVAGFEPSLAGRLVFEGKAKWEYPGDPRQAELVEQARLAAESASHRRPATGLPFGVVGTAASYLDGAA